MYIKLNMNHTNCKWTDCITFNFYWFADYSHFHSDTHRSKKTRPVTSKIIWIITFCVCSVARMTVWHICYVHSSIYRSSQTLSYVNKCPIDTKQTSAVRRKTALQLIKQTQNVSAITLSAHAMTHNVHLNNVWFRVLIDSSIRFYSDNESS